MPDPNLTAPPAPLPEAPGFLQFFDTVLPDPCSAFLVALVAHGLAAFVLAAASTSPDRAYESTKRRGTLAGAFCFLLLCCAEYLRRGPDWGTILLLSGLRAWIVASLVRLLLACLSLFGAGVWAPFVSRRKVSQERLAHERYRARLAEEQARKQAEEARRPLPVIPPRPPPPTFESDVAVLLDRFEQLKEATRKLPIPQDEQDARIRFLKDKLDEHLNLLLEKYTQ